MTLDLNFDLEALKSLIGGRAVVETPRLAIRSLEAAHAYLKTYGYSVELESDRDRLWQIHSRAVIYIRTQLLKEGETIPEEVSDAKQLEDVGKLLLMASNREGVPAHLHGWACALLRVMHVISQLQNDLFNYFSMEIQEEIFRPYRTFIQKDSVTGIALVGGTPPETIALQKFDIKPFKDSDSAITKLLAKPDEVAFGLLDKIGVRFVTNSMFDVFRVMRFLINNHVVSPANVIPNQSNNTLYPIELFLDVIEKLPKENNWDVADLDRHLQERLTQEASRVRYLEKHNQFTSKDYRFMKFITRQLVRVTMPDSQRAFSFFYPYEVQILDYQHYLRSLAGPASHDEYKGRQREKARSRVLV